MDGRGIAVIASALTAGVTGCGGSDSSGGERPATNVKPSRPASAAAPLKANVLGRQELPHVRAMVTGLIDGVNGRDPAICTRFYTARYRQTLMKRKGSAALAKCRKEARAATVTASLVGIEVVDLHRASTGEIRGRVQLVERIGNAGLLRAHFGVVRRAGGYLIDTGRGEQIPDPTPSPSSSAPGA